ncbi:MAG: hypothetical protein R6V41_10090 [Desulfobacteraceae bacterium]
MYITALVIFMAGIIAGTAWGITYADSALRIAAAAVVGGFAGSAAGAVCFTCMYLFSPEDKANPGSSTDEAALEAPETDPGRILSGPSDETRIREIEKELDHLKKNTGNKRA